MSFNTVFILLGLVAVYGFPCTVYSVYVYLCPLQCPWCTFIFLYSVIWYNSFLRLLIKVKGNFKKKSSISLNNILEMIQNYNIDDFCFVSSTIKQKLQLLFYIMHVCIVVYFLYLCIYSLLNCVEYYKMYWVNMQCNLVQYMQCKIFCFVCLGSTESQEKALHFGQ